MSLPDAADLFFRAASETKKISYDLRMKITQRYEYKLRNATNKNFNKYFLNTRIVRWLRHPYCMPCEERNVS